MDKIRIVDALMHPSIASCINFKNASFKIPSTQLVHVYDDYVILCFA
jgi:hypothetical protein